MDKTEKATAAFNQYAEQYAVKYMNVDLYLDGLTFITANICLPSPKVLDVACGPGNITKFMQDALPEAQLTGIDLAPRMLELAQKHVPGGKFLMMDCREIGQMEQKFDLVICGFVLPYLNPSEASALIRNAYNLLNSGGMLYLSTMEGKPEATGWHASSSGDGPSVFIQYYTRQFLEDELAKSQFQIAYSQILDYCDSQGKQARDLIFIGKK